MFLSAYKFSSTQAGALTFNEDEKFVILDDTIDEHWWTAVNENGSIGFVPGGYLVPSTSVDVSDYIKMIDRAVINLRQNNGSTTAADLKKRNDSLEKLEARRIEFLRTMGMNKSGNNTAAEGTQSKRRAPAPPSEEPVIHSNPNPNPNHAPGDKKLTSLPHTGDSIVSGNDKNLEDPLHRETNNQSIDTAGLTSELIESVRKNTKLSYDMLRVAVATVLSLLGGRVPSVVPVIEPILHRLNSTSEVELTDADETSEDGRALRRILSELNSVREDSQQRSWILHEDEEMICNNINNLISILSGANPSVCKRIISADHFSSCESLVKYYQMETRVSIRLLLLEAFGCLCSLDRSILSELLNSVLPIELARDMQNDSSDVRKFKYSGTLFSMLFCTGERVPPDYYVHLNSELISFLIDCVEHGVEGDDSDQVPDVCVKSLLSFNLHFDLPEENIIMNTLADRRTAKILTEKLLILFNREVDPVRHFEYIDNAQNSVIKFMMDLYSSPSTANLLYSNDSRVLIDIITRQLSDLPPGNKMRTEYLSLVQLIFTNTDYFDHSHRLTDLTACFNRIMNEEEELGGGVGGARALEIKSSIKQDKDIIRVIFNQFSRYLKKS